MCILDHHVGITSWYPQTMCIQDKHVDIAISDLLSKKILKKSSLTKKKTWKKNT